MRSKVPQVSDNEAIEAFIKGLNHHNALRDKLLRKRPDSISTLINITRGYADADDHKRILTDGHRDDDRNRRESHDRRDDGRGWYDGRGNYRDRREQRDHRRNRRDDHRGKRTREDSDEVNAVRKIPTDRNYEEDYTKAFKGQCQLHPKAKHSMEECRVLKNFFAPKEKQGSVERPQGQPPHDDEEEDRDRDPRHNYSQPIDHVAIIMGGRVSVEDQRDQKKLARKCFNISNTNTLIADPKFPPWSHQEITFNRQDQWAAIPEPGRFPLVLDPCINNVVFERVLIDGGSSIDILFKNSLLALKLTKKDLRPYTAQF